MLLVSGSDLVGKTTFCRQALSALNAAGRRHMLQHLSRPCPAFDEFHDYVGRLYQYSVWDRFALDSLMYRQHDDRECSMTPMKYRLVDSHVRLYGGFIVVLLASDEDLKERHARRGDDMYPLEHILKINRSFRELMYNRLITVRGQVYNPHVDIVCSDTAQWGSIIESYMTHLEQFEETTK